MQPIIYNSLDASAPQLTIAAGTLKTILKACLVTGYGSKPAAGWEIAWADDVANKIAIRSKNPTSTKSVLLVKDDAAASATVTAYTGWDSTENTGNGQFATGYFVKQWDTEFTPNWVVIATDKFFYLFVQTESTYQTMRAMSGFGDAISLRNDKFFSVCLCHRANNMYSVGYVGYTEVFTGLNKTAQFPRSLFKKDPNYTEAWGDRSYDSDKTTSNIAIFSNFALYMKVDVTNEPVLQLPGLLMPYSGIIGYKTDNNIDHLDNQLPYKNPIIGMQQPWHGRVWIQTDDWG